MTDELDTGEPQLPEALLRALRAPGTPEELAGEADVLAAFRAAHKPAGTAPRMRLVGRLGAGGIAAATTLVLGSGVAAAAYTSSLPEPVQQLAHRVLAPIGVPAAAPRPHRPRHAVTQLPQPSASPSGPAEKPSHHAHGSPTRKPTTKPTPKPKPSPSGPTPTSSGAPAPAPTTGASPNSSPTASPSTVATASPSRSSTPTASPSATASSSPTARPSGTPTPVPAQVSLTLSATRVSAGSTVRASGSVLDSAGRPVARQRIALQATIGAGWVTVASGVSDRAGGVALFTPAVTQNTRLRLKVTGRSLPRPLLSPVARVTEAPELLGTFTGRALSISAVGALPGDMVQIGLVHDGVVSPVGTVTLSGSEATYAVTQTSTKQRYVVVLPRTSRHAAARVSVVVPASGGR